MSGRTIVEHIKADLQSYLERIDQLEDDLLPLVVEAIRQLEIEAEQGRFDRIADNSQDEQAAFDAIIRVQERIAMYGK